MTRLCTLFLSVSVLIAPSIGWTNEPIKPLVVRLKEAREACYGRDWKKEECVFKDSSKDDHWNFQRDAGDDVYGLYVRDLVLISDLVQMAANYSTPLQACSTYFDPDRLIFNAFMVELKRKAKELKLSNCQKSCFANCVTSHLLKYVPRDESSSLLERSDLEVFCDGYGVCMEYATLGDTFQEAVGVKSRTRYDKDGNLAHAFLKVTFDGKSYYAEPQSDQCVFYNID